jgi:hypothetical protein
MWAVDYGVVGLMTGVGMWFFHKMGRVIRFTSPLLSGEREALECATSL